MTWCRLLSFAVVYGLGYGASFAALSAKPALMFGDMPEFGTPWTRLKDPEDEVCYGKMDDSLNGIMCMTNTI
eukprot:5473720-Amphidinium_carterae.1